MASSEKSGTPFPGEIADNIIDHLHDDYSALQQCALVCSDWLPSSRHHLFGSFSSGPRKHALTDLIDFLTSTPDVGAHVKRFSLYEYQGISLENICKMLHALPNVSVVELVCLLVPVPSRYDPPLTPLTKKLSALRVTTSGGPNTRLDQNLFPFLSLFTVVHSLRLETDLSPRFMSIDAVDPRAMSIPNTLQVSELSTYNMHPRLIVELFRPFQVARWETLQSLELDRCIERWEQYAEVGNLLKVIGPRLRRLSLKQSSQLLAQNFFAGNANFGGGWVPPAESVHGEHVWEALNLAKCTNLDVFAVDVRYTNAMMAGPGPDRRDDTHALFKLNIDLLRHIPANVRCVRVQIRPSLWYAVPPGGVDNPDVTFGGPLHTIDWPTFDETLSDSRFTNLRVVLDVSVLKQKLSTAGFHSILAYLTGSLHRIRRRGTLAFEMNTWSHWT
ncbi:hypothetical protein C8Q79DRAFT_1024570 [Trametes meyenii]|nr:hypothetical protein C8Q79DRAFT_1024570 [Trametes meyenii]